MITTDITLITKCKVLNPLDDLDSYEQICDRNLNGCTNIYFHQTSNIEVIAKAKVIVDTIEVEKDFYEDRINYKAVEKLARASMRQVRRQKKQGGTISQIEFSIIAVRELMDFHTAEIENRLAKEIKK